MPRLHQEPLDEVISEHERLVRVLRSPSHANDRREAKKQAQELTGMQRQRARQGWPLKKPAATPHSGIEVGDELYFQHPHQGPVSGTVLCHGAHGVTLKCARGQRHQVRWDRLLGVKQRLNPTFTIVDQGEDGLVLADDRGQRRFLRWPANATPDPNQDTRKLKSC